MHTAYNSTDLRLRTISAWGNDEPRVPKGAPFQYANLGYIISGAMIEKAAGKPWVQLIVERIFTPLDLRTAGFRPQATMGKIDAPVGHQISDDGKVTPMLWGAAADPPPVIGPAGNVHMSILDFAPGPAGMQVKASAVPPSSSRRRCGSSTPRRSRRL